MALIDIDRHILMDLAENNAEIGKQLTLLSEVNKKVEALHERNTALILHLVKVIQVVDTNNGREVKK